jgi:BirA family transcriptional regulator, biotin operon repressor / biotin---[acetyl-CoA-carboxylase] ligase
MGTRHDIANPWPDALVIWKDRTSSTMDDARALAREGCPTGTVVMAGFQERGRGRVPGRTWLSPPGQSLLATVILDIPGLGFPPHELPLRAGVAAAEAVEDASGVRGEIKWPNDLIVDGRKLAGLLCETHAGSALVGVGINCAQAGFPPEIDGAACSLLQICGRAIPPETLLAALLVRLKEEVEGHAWRERLLGRLYRLGTPVRVGMPGSDAVIEGTVRGVDARGGLELQLSDGRRRTLFQGEILLP